jgi:GH15 family glucan-1,4-alpha-glucosidase
VATDQEPSQPGLEFPPIEDYGLIGDCRSAALVSRDGSIDWLCWPRFDSPAVFAALLDQGKGGRFQIAPAQPFHVERRYLHNSNVLLTRFQTATGRLELTDAFYATDEAPPPGRLMPLSMLIRSMRCLEGEVPLRIYYQPRRDYGKDELSLKNWGVHSLVGNLKEGLLHLAADFEIRGGPDPLDMTLRLRAGETRSCILSLNENGPAVYPPLDRVQELIDATDRYWRAWAGHVEYEGEHRDAVVRSALTLKLMVYAPSGAPIAAPTASLPERIGASYNWDYRYCWLRDASFTINALFGLGLDSEARSFQQWLLHATRLTQPELQVVYSVMGKPLLKERILDHLTGYRDSSPVRIGNAAHGQKQLDIYGEVMNAAVIGRDEGVRLTGDERSFLEGIAKYVMAHWQDADAGIWETREGDRHHLHSKAMCWVALDRAGSLAESGELSLDATRLRAAAGEIKDAVERMAFNEEFQAYTATFDGADLDASVLRLPLVGFESASAPRMASTIEAIRAGLGRDDLIYRHHGSETADEGAFLICSFWLVEDLVLQGKLDEAESIFRALCARANDLGLFPEEIDPEDGSFLGNFPQAFTHIGLINAALRLQSARQA